MEAEVLRGRFLCVSRTPSTTEIEYQVFVRFPAAVRIPHPYAYVVSHGGVSGKSFQAVSWNYFDLEKPFYAMMIHRLHT